MNNPPKLKLDSPPLNGKFMFLLDGANPFAGVEYLEVACIKSLKWTQASA